MSTEYSSKEGALFMGMFYAGRADLYKEGEKERTIDEVLKNPEIKILNSTIDQFGYIHEDSMILEFKNRDGKLINICTTKFRDGYDLWLVDPISGVAVRT